jgi:hypothetical protein
VRSLLRVSLLMLLIALCAAVPASADPNGPFVVLEAPGDGALYYQGQQVQAAYACLAGPLGWPAVTCDADAPLGSFIDTTNVGEHTFTVHAVDYAGAETTMTHTYTVVDVNPPSIAITSPGEHAVYPYGAEVFVHYTCDDGAGGSGVLACLGSLPDGAPLPTNRLGTFAVQVDAFDNAFNHATAAHFYQVVDVTPPTITINTPSQDAQYHVGDVVNADYSCHDDVEGSNVACSATPVDTSTVGTHTFRVDSRDSSGNSASATRTYSVVYDFGGFSAPLVAFPSIATVKAGDPVPVKFSLNGYHGLDVLAGQPAWKPSCNSTAPDSSSAVGSLTYNAGADRYVFLWSNDRAWVGSCRELLVTLRDGTIHLANVQFGK